MSGSNKLSYYLRKHFALRLLLLVLIVGVGLLVFSFASKGIKEKPAITDINPSIGTPGDVLLINGKAFGDTQKTSFVEVSGNRLTASSYLSWSDNQIKVIIPGNTQDGLIYVISEAGRSNPDFFATKDAIPIAMPQDPMLSTPVITSLSNAEVRPGQLITITGKNFGLAQEDSEVYFSSKHDIADSSSIPIATEGKADKSTQGMIPASDADFDYEYWSESEIRVRVPDGATSGSVFVLTSKGKSLAHPISIKTFGGTKDFDSKHTYLIQVTADISKITGSKDGMLTLRVPNPIITASQPMASMSESNPKPFLENYNDTSIFQIETRNDSVTKQSIKQSFVVTSYAVKTYIDIDQIGIFSDKGRLLYKNYTKADSIVPAYDSKLTELLPSIIYQSKNPYRQAKLIYEFMIKNYKVLNRVRMGNVSPLDMIKSERGDAYDFAILYTALLRTAGVPARPISGILIDSDRSTKSHWWCEFYIENFGWVPCDPALGAGLEYKPFQSTNIDSSFYFGNLDSQHIVFSKSYNSAKQSLANSRIVSFPRTYALQSIWEEATPGIISYSSLWNAPTVFGIY